MVDDRAQGGVVSDAVEISLPVRADLVALARFAAATIASRAQFDVEEIEDLRLAVDELCISVAGGADDGSLQLRFLLSGDQIEVECTYVSAGGPRPGGGGDRIQPDLEWQDDLSLRIVDALVDEHGQDTHGGHPRAWLRKRRAPGPR
jgi:hypothetical protein